jgi:hypothetical protein
MKRVLLWLILVPVMIVAIAFCVGNRQIVDVIFDPFAKGAAGQFAVKIPLFLVIILALAVGVLLGSLFTWLGQGRHRRALREARGEMTRLRTDVDRMKI